MSVDQAVSDDAAISLDPQVAETERNMAAAGVPVADSGEVDYFGFSDTKRVKLPDGKQWVDIKALNEGERTKFQSKTSRDVVVARTSGDARLRMAPELERHALLEEAIIGWSVRRKDPNKGDYYDVPFTRQFLKEFLDTTNPTITNLIEKEVRKLNPWTMNEMSSDDIKREISDLEELLEVKLREEAGNVSSSGK